MVTLALYQFIDLSYFITVISQKSCEQRFLHSSNKIKLNHALELLENTF